MPLDPSLIVDFVIERHTFRTFHYVNGEAKIATAPMSCPEEINVLVESASTTRGRSLIIPGVCDSTGIMIWPASYLMCQYLAYSLSMNDDQHSRNSTILGSKILELGCGSGIVGITAALTNKAFPSSRPVIIVSTDIDDDAIQLCNSNIQRNDLNPSGSTANLITAHTLSWGSDTDISSLKNQVGSFDSLIAADIVYPTTTNETLAFLFQTVDQMLNVGGSFLLSFVSRDGFKTPRRFIQAASRAKYKIDFIPYKSFMHLHWTNFLPPLLDAILLFLVRDEDAERWNDQLGSNSCPIFPGMKEESLHITEYENEEWEAPQCFDDDENQSYCNVSLS